MTEFDTLAPRTLYDDEALKTDFETGLLPALRSRIYMMTPAPTTLQGWKDAAVTLHSQWEREKTLHGNRDRKPAAQTTIAATPTPRAAASTANLAAASTSDPRPALREVIGPNGKSLADYFALMKGRCSGCGLTTHRKEACTLKTQECSYCKGIGHKREVCIDRFLGRQEGGRAPKRQRIAASSETPFSLFAEDSAVPSTSTDF